MEPGIIFRSWGGMYRSTFFKAPTGSALYYADENGKMAVGKKQIDGDWYYFKDWGGMYQNAFIKNGTSVCHAAADGKLTVGWLQQGSTYYYFGERRL